MANPSLGEPFQAQRGSRKGETVGMCSATTSPTPRIISVCWEPTTYIPMVLPPHEVAKVFRDHGEAYREAQENQVLKRQLENGTYKL